MRQEWTEAELARKRPIWIALSELFLDTEVRASLPRIALKALQLGIDEEELWETLECEVAPVLSSNLLSPAGEWACFDEEWLCQKITAGGPGGRRNVLERIANRAARFYYREYRPPLALLLEHLQTRSEPQRETVKLSDLAKLYIEKDWTKLFCLWSTLKRLSYVPMEELNDAFEDVIERSYSGLLTNSGDPTPKRARQNFEWYIDFLTWCEDIHESDPEVVVECGEQLSYFCSVENLPQTPRWESTILELRTSPLSLEQTEDLLFGPLCQLYSTEELARANWARYTTCR